MSIRSYATVTTSLTVEDVAAFVRKVSYMPGTHIRVFPTRGTSIGVDAVTITISVPVPNSDDRGATTIPVTSQVVIPMVQLRESSDWREQVMWHIESLFISLATHEVKEWLRIDGKWFKAPHPELGQKDWRSNE